ncbi:MAG: hypothetical protein MUF61_03245 [archaeon]|jgi:hypothetical protein|nr:hypothetical protein [archaeon]
MKFLEDLVSPEDVRLARLFLGVDKSGEVLRVDWERLLGVIPIDGNGRMPTEDEFNTVLNAFCLGGVMSTKAKGNYSVITDKGTNANPSLMGVNYLKDCKPETAYFAREEDALKYILAFRTKFNRTHDNFRVIRNE